MSQFDPEEPFTKLGSWPGRDVKILAQDAPFKISSAVFLCSLLRVA